MRASTPSPSSRSLQN